MAHLYLLNLTPYFAGGWRALLEEMSPQRRQQALSCRQEADRVRSAGAGWLLCHALEREGIAREEQKFSENPWGKPELLSADAVHFSLSHSGPWAVCAVGSSPLGVDIESPRCTLPMAQRFFHPREAAFAAALPPQRQAQALCRLWTAKEACCKAAGQGFSLPMSSFCVELTPAGARLAGFLPDQPRWNLHEYDLAPYRMCLCTTEARPEPEILTAAPEGSDAPQTGE